MELPKNITQIGESDRNCKVYAEDYVISYIKQLNLPAQDKDMAVALYGIRKEENDVSYIFLYGACKLDFLQRESRHLSQAQYQEVEKLRKKYFADYAFLGYRLLNGEMVEGFHICEQGVCRYVAGYAQFYEKNDSMLAYMLDTRTQEVPPERVSQEKYDVVKQRQEERRALAEGRSLTEGRSALAEQSTTGERNAESVAIHSKGTEEKSGQLMKKYRFSTVAAFTLLCVVGLSALSGDGRITKLQMAARQMLEGVKEQKLPDDSESENMAVRLDTLVAEDKLAEAVQRENEGLPVQSSDVVTTLQGNEQDQTDALGEDAGQQENAEGQQGTSGEQEKPAEGQQGTTGEQQDTSDSGNQKAEALPEEGGTMTAADNNGKTETSEEASKEVIAPVGYVIQKGDTLIGISIRQYGSDTRVSEICSLNGISNPDDIKVGQKILLP